MAADGTDVSPDRVSDFGEKTRDEAMDFQKGALSSMSSVVSAQPRSGMDAAVSFGNAHTERFKAFQMFAQDASTGLMALGFGALTIAQNYREADMSQAKQMNSVDAAFNPAAGTPSIASDQADQAAQAKEAPAKTPAGNPPDLPRPAPPAPVDSCEPPTPAEQVIAHNKIYGKDENWLPGQDD